jgi:hypothetical protein
MRSIHWKKWWWREESDSESSVQMSRHMIVIDSSVNAVRVSGETR